MKSHTLLLGAVMALVVLAAPPPALSQTPAPLHLVTTVWPPFTNAPGQARFALDLVDEALKRIGMRAETAIVDDAKFTTELLTGAVDGSPAAWKDAEREKALLFSEPYLENRLILVGRKGSDVSAASLAALAGKRIVVVGGYAYGDAVTKGSGPTFVLSKSEEDSMAMLLAGKADYTLMDELVVQYILDNHGEQARNRLQVGSTPLLVRPLYLAIRRSRPDAQSIVTRFNAELRKLITDRTYHRLLHVDWISADVDGDGRKEMIFRTDQAGPAPPTRSYDLFTSAMQPRSDSGAAVTKDLGPRVYVGGTVYETWTAVPPRYRAMDPSKPDATRSGGTIFRFVW
jgi:polar amino acid transport system substrate-binding protein